MEQDNDQVQSDALPSIVISSEADAFQILNAAIEGRLEPWGEVKFDGWPTLTIYLKGTQFNQTITPPVMKALLEFQKGIYQSYASAKYNNPIKRLSDSEKKALEIRVKVESGSSEFSIDVQELAIEFIKQMGGKMESTHILIALITFLVLYFGTTSYKKYLEDRKEIRLKEVSDDTQRKTLEALQFISTQDTKRTEILAKALSINSSIHNIGELAHDSQTDLLRAMSTADEGRLGGVDLNGKTAFTLVQNARRKSSEIRLDGRYMLRRLDWTAPSGCRVKVYNVESGLELDADLQDQTLNGDYRSLLQRAEWSRSAIRLQINARNVGGEYKGAVILKVEPDIGNQNS